MITDCGPSKGARRCLSHEKSYQGQKSGWSNLSCHCWDYSERLSNLLKFKLKCPFTAPKSKSRMRPRPSMLWWSFLLIVALLLESSMVSCFPVIPASESPSSTSQVHPKHHHHRHQVRHHHHHQRDRAAKQQHPKHFHVESLEVCFLLEINFFNNVPTFLSVYYFIYN